MFNHNIDDEKIDSESLLSATKSGLNGQENQNNAEARKAFPAMECDHSVCILTWKPHKASKKRIFPIE